MKIFIINLREDKIKKYHISKELKKYNLNNATFFNAINGNIDKQAYNIYDKFSNQIIKTIGRRMSLGEIGCLLSHKNIYKFIVDNKIKEALILEDDVKFTKEIKKILLNNKSHLKYDILLLGYHDISSRDSFDIGQRYILKNKSACIYKNTKKSHGAYGYIVSYNGAKKLLKYLKTPYEPIDHYTGNAEKLKCFSIFPITIKLEKRFLNKSNLDIQREYYKIIRDDFKLSIVNKILKDIEKLPNNSQIILYGFNDISKYIYFKLNLKNIKIVDTFKHCIFRNTKITSLQKINISTQTNTFFYITTLQEKYITQIQQIIKKYYYNSKIKSFLDFIDE